MENVSALVDKKLGFLMGYIKKRASQSGGSSHSTAKCQFIKKCCEPRNTRKWFPRKLP